MARRAWLLDLDGVVWRGDSAVIGSADAIAETRSRGDQVLFVTNSAMRTRAQVAAKLARHGIPDAEPLVVTSAMAAAHLLGRGDKVLACGGAGLVDELGRVGAELVGPEPADAVVVGLTTEFDYGMLKSAMRAVRAGARLVATNDDSTYPDSDGLSPGNGALVAAVERASGSSAVVAGKPHPPMVSLIRELLDPAAEAVVVGDRPETDGLLAQALGVPFLLVLSGVTGDLDLPVTPTPGAVGADLQSVIDLWTLTDADPAA